MARGAALVHRQGRHDRQLLGRLQRLQIAALRPPGPQGDHHVLLDRRPVRRRHALHGRDPAERHPRLGLHVLDAARPAARSAARRRPLAPDMCSSASSSSPSWSRTGSATSGGTGSGSTARSTRTTRTSSARCSRSAAGWTATRTRSRGSSPSSRCRASGSSARGRTTTATRPPGPNFDFMHEAVRFFDHWLKGMDTGIMREPMLRAFMQEDVPPRGVLRGLPRPLGRRAGVAPARRPGDWGSISARAGRSGCGPAARPPSRTARTRRSASEAASGVRSASAGDGPQCPGDQREDDVRSLVIRDRAAAPPAGDPRPAGGRARAGGRQAGGVPGRPAQRRLSGRPSCRG